ncbi:hypothetical protein KY306_00025 [Candidatus Woesearchaeota archaeon]|nr:hypothetical protein [Candidatus Woesearchaeota archaeon]
MSIKEIVNESLEHVAHKIGLGLYTQGHEAVLAGDTKSLREAIVKTNPEFRGEFLIKLVKYNEELSDISQKQIAKDAWTIFSRLLQRQPVEEIEKTMGIQLSPLLHNYWKNEIPNLRSIEEYLCLIEIQKYHKNTDCFFSVTKELDQQSAE